MKWIRSDRIDFFFLFFSIESEIARAILSLSLSLWSVYNNVYCIVTDEYKQCKRMLDDDHVERLFHREGKRDEEKKRRTREKVIHRYVFVNLCQ